MGNSFWSDLNEFLQSIFRVVIGKTKIAERRCAIYLRNVIDICNFVGSIL